MHARYQLCQRLFVGRFCAPSFFLNPYWSLISPSLSPLTLYGPIFQLLPLRRCSCELLICITSRLAEHQAVKGHNGSTSKRATLKGRLSIWRKAVLLLARLASQA